jgi:PHD/YefM family antitoxin component YafN of YafNO toxin-antitoxin module
MATKRTQGKRSKRAMSETEYLLRSPNNARRLMASLKEAEAGKGLRMTVEELRRLVGLTEK